MRRRSVVPHSCGQRPDEPASRLAGPVGQVAGLIAGKRVLVVEDGPAVTHGGMPYGAGTLAARKFGAKESIDPRPFAVGSIADAFREYHHLREVLPALGYSAARREELQQTINASGADAIVDASPAGLNRVPNVKLPVVRVNC